MRPLVKNSNIKSQIILNQFLSGDPFLNQAVSELVKKEKCHTVLLYGSRARADATETSDYDLMGVRKTGTKKRLAEKRVVGTLIFLFFQSAT